MQRTEAKHSGMDIGIDEGGNWRGDGWSRGHEALPVPTAKLGLWLFLGVVAMLFAALSSAYIVRKPMPDWQNFVKPPILWVNTIVLLLSSLSLHWSWVAGRKGKLTVLRNGLLFTLVLGSLFVAGQLLAWRKLAESGIYLSTNPASSFFYLLTALHGLHILGGIVVLVWVTARVWQKRNPNSELFGVELCALYWHFLAIVWLWLLLLMR